MEPMLDGTPLLPSQSYSRPGVLVLGGSIGALGAARSLGRNGVAVWLLCEGSGVASLSRYVARTLAWAGAEADGALAELVGLATTHGLQGWLVVAAGDPEARLLARNHDEVAKVFRTTVPRYDVVRWADDKVLTYNHAQTLGLATPRLYAHDGLEDIAELDCLYPVIVKPAVHEGASRFDLAKAWVVKNRTELLARYREAISCVEPRHIVVQEMIPGDGSTQLSYAGLWKDGRPLAGMVAKRLRQYPIHVGYTSTFVQVVENPAVEAAADRFLRSIGYSGLVEVEFKYDSRDDKYKILDVNARLWSWVGLGAAAQVDFPMMLYRATLGEELAPARATIGQAWSYTPRDLIAALHEIRVGRLRLRDYLQQVRRGSTAALFAFDDPLPAIAELPIVAYRVLTRRLLRPAGQVRSRARADAGAAPGPHSTHRSPTGEMTG
jgi:D-aspartate ligase